ncbi:DUF4232 domain-containing protein [Mangrovihabitans endophyticus]|uniref:DUF4232 domain-containing protein n=1 Tax=Mangrovihabitans endophyticus TaxID=1751298 RepID=A0A8J3C3S9_9ACTN|nr:DUF4232 domain-containing protein [Mangrovihabitans endophyticus]GGL10916.1 hypothetical protein GCM10012284_52020 [Mangrovihabitans endophyticus]
MRRIRTALLITVPLTLLLAGCGGDDDDGAAAPAPGTAGPGATASANTGTGPSPAASATGSNGGGTNGGGTNGDDANGDDGSSGGGSQGGSGSGDPGRCHTSDLSIADAPDPNGGAAGSYGELLVFTNKSADACTLYGYPGVSWVAGDDGTRVNDPFQRSGGDRATLRLEPGEHAHATLVLVRAGNFGADDCKPAKVRGYRVYPPDETASIFVEKPQTVCSAKGKGLGQVRPLVAGTTG